MVIRTNNIAAEQKMNALRNIKGNEYVNGRIAKIVTVHNHPAINAAMSVKMSSVLTNLRTGALIALNFCNVQMSHRNMTVCIGVVLFGLLGLKKESIGDIFRTQKEIANIAK